mmetsp:Transcript_28654/g.42426  ORF Transcript_28654/g.42426 Transcript_28654/m.42426 type:complete len:213 (-) Transcript_28654:534-1172(-)
MYKSPAGPPLGPASPSPLTRSLLPSSTPGGMVTLICFVFCVKPCPEQVPQYSSTFWPVPLQVAHVCCVWKLPRGVLVTCIVTPEPLHTGQVLTELPGLIPSPLQVSHVSKCRIRTFSSPPKMAVLKSISRSNRKSSPAMGPRVRPPRAPAPRGPAPPPPKKLSKMSPKSTSCPKPPPPNGFPACWSLAADVPIPCSPKRSYLCRRSSFERTS